MTASRSPHLQSAQARTLGCPTLQTSLHRSPDSDGIVAPLGESVNEKPACLYNPYPSGGADLD